MTTGGGRSRRDLTLDPVVEFGSSAQQQVDARAEGGVGRQEQGGLPALLLRPHPAQQLLEDKKWSLNTDNRPNYGGPEGNMFVLNAVVSYFVSIKFGLASYWGGDGIIFHRHGV